MADNPLYQEALSGAAGTTWRGKTLKMVGRDHLAAMKVKAYAERKDPGKRETDRRDVLGAVAKGTDPETLREILKRTAPQFLPALEEILSGGNPE